jgi:serine/threonine-protein kinase
VALERVVMRAIQKLPADRYPTAEAMAEVLEELATARSGLRGQALLVRALEGAGLVSPSEAGDGAAPRRRKKLSARPAIAGLAMLGAAGILGGALVQTRAHRDGDTAGSRPLDLLPPSPGYLRVLVTPWAEVWVDGQRVDVTPFARPIPLPEGTHYVTLVHPSAPVEKRTVAIVHGETRTIDAVMNMPELGPAEDAAPEEVSADKGGPPKDNQR